MDPDNFSHTFSKLCQKAGLVHWHPHELRHSGTSLMLAQGTPLHVVSEILGHASITITKDVYAPAGGRQVSGGDVDEPGSVRVLNPVAPSVAPKTNDKGPFHDRNGPLNWAQPEGFEPPTFCSVGTQMLSEVVQISPHAG